MYIVDWQYPDSRQLQVGDRVLMSEFVISDNKVDLRVVKEFEVQTTGLFAIRPNGVVSANGLLFVDLKRLADATGFTLVCIPATELSTHQVKKGE